MVGSSKRFLDALWSFYDSNRREMPWRNPEPDGSYDPYKILVSEIMLQQTQVDRVIPKYLAFINRFPTPESLAAAPFSEVLRFWNGLGYNRRAKYIHEAAKMLAVRTFPKTIDELTELKGVGSNTAAAILVYAYNQPHIFIETNIRSVLFYHFFSEKHDISDGQLRNLLQKLLRDENPRDFYYALMDYGAYLKQNGFGQNSKSKHYSKQSKFEGSIRQLRGEVLRRALDGLDITQLKRDVSDTRLEYVIDALVSEGLILKSGSRIKVADS